MKTLIEKIANVAFDRSQRPAHPTRKLMVLSLILFGYFAGSLCLNHHRIVGHTASYLQQLPLTADPKEADSRPFAKEVCFECSLLTSQQIENPPRRTFAWIPDFGYALASDTDPDPFRVVFIVSNPVRGPPLC